MTVCLKIIAINSLFLSSINLSIYHKSLSAIDQSTWCVFSLSKLNGGFPFARFPVFFRAWLLRAVFSYLAVTCFLASGCCVFFRAWLLRVFPRLAVSCFSALGCYVFSRAWLLRTKADKGQYQLKILLKSEKQKFKSHCFWRIIIKHFIEDKKLLQILIKLLDPQILSYKAENV